MKKNGLINFNKKVFEKHKCLIAMLYSFLFLVIVYIYAYPCWEGSDDFMISGVLSGISGQASPYVLVIGFLLSRVLVWLQENFAFFNWLTLLEIFSVWISFSIIISIFLEQKKILYKIIGILIPIIFEFNFYMSLNYTRSACLLCFSGLILTVYSIIVKQNMRLCIIGSALFVLGSQLRFACVFLVIPFVGVWMIQMLWSNREEVNLAKKINKVVIVTILLAIIIVLLKYINNYEYDKFSSESNYIKYNTSHSKAYDYLVNDYDEHRDEFEKIGISKNDYDLIKYGIVFDEYFDQELFDKIAEINNKTSETFQEHINNFKMVFWNRMSRYQSGKRTGEKNIIYIFMLIAFMGIFFLRRESLFGYFCSILGTIIISCYFVWTGRYPPWVQDSVYFIGAVSVCYSLTTGTLPLLFFKYRDLKKEIDVGIICIVLLSIVCVESNSIIIKYSEQSNKDDVQDIWAAFEFMQSNKQNVYLVDTFSNCPYPIIYAYGSLRGLENGSWSNIMRVGTWFLGHPTSKKQLESLEIESPMKELINSNVYMFTLKEGNNLDKYVTFLNEDYDYDVYYEEQYDFGAYAIYKFIMY